jgi:hypothetical protein
MVDNASKLQAWCRETGGIPYPCERGKPQSSMRNKGYVPVERMNNKPGTNEDSRLPGLPRGSNNICCWRKILPPMTTISRANPHQIIPKIHKRDNIIIQRFT